MSNGKAEKRSRATTTCEFVAKCADTPAGWCLLVTRRKYDQVITQLKEALKNDTENAELLSHLGMVYYKVGFYDNAIKTLQEASDAPTQQLTFNPRHNLAYVLHYTGQYRQAWENWHEAVKNYKILDDAREAYYCGIIFDQIFRDSAEAERWYKRAIEKQPGWDRAWLQLALLYNNMATEGGDSAFDALSGRAKAFREAREALEAKLRKHDDADVHHRLAVLYLGTGELTKAEDQLTKAGEALDKEDQEYKAQRPLRVYNEWRWGTLRSLQAECQPSLVRRNRHYEKALEHLQNAKQMQPDNFAIQTDLGAVYLKLGQFEYAEDVYKNLLYNFAQENVDALIGLAQVYMELAERGDAEHFMDAEKFLSRAIKHRRSDTGSRRLSDREYCNLLYQRAYVRSKQFEMKSGSGVCRPSLTFMLSSIEQDMRECNEYNHPNASEALNKVREKKVEWLIPQRFLEIWGAWLICVLALFIFVLAQCSFFIGDLPLSDSAYYVSSTFVALSFMCIGLYLPQILKLKLGSISLEKESTNYIAPVNIGLRCDKMCDKRNSDTAELSGTGHASKSCDGAPSSPVNPQQPSKSCVKRMCNALSRSQV